MAASAGPDHQFVKGNPAFGNTVDKPDALLEREGICLARGAEKEHSVAAVGQEPLAVSDQRFVVDAQVPVKRCETGGENAVRQWCVDVHSGSGKGCIRPQNYHRNRKWGYGSFAWRRWS